MRLIHEMRKAGMSLDEQRRWFLGNVNTRTLTHKASDAIAMIYTVNDRPYAAAWVGKRARPEFHNWFHSEADMFETIERTFADRAKSQAAKTVRQALKKAAAHAHGVEVGNIFRSSWGYEQTNIDYYQVTKLVGRTMVEVREIARNSWNGEHYMTGYCVPLPDDFIGKPLRRKVQTHGSSAAIAINSFSHAFLIAPKLKDGELRYDPDYWTSYA